MSQYGFPSLFTLFYSFHEKMLQNIVHYLTGLFHDFYLKDIIQLFFPYKPYLYVLTLFEKQYKLCIHIDSRTFSELYISINKCIYYPKDRKDYVILLGLPITPKTPIHQSIEREEHITHRSFLCSIFIFFITNVSYQQQFIYKFNAK